MPILVPAGADHHRAEGLLADRSELESPKEHDQDVAKERLRPEVHRESGALALGTLPARTLEGDEPVIRRNTRSFPRSRTRANSSASHACRALSCARARSRCSDARSLAATAMSERYTPPSTGVPRSRNRSGPALSALGASGIRMRVRPCSTSARSSSESGKSVERNAADHLGSRAKASCASTAGSPGSSLSRRGFNGCGGAGDGSPATPTPEDNRGERRSAHGSGPLQ